MYVCDNSLCVHDKVLRVSAHCVAPVLWVVPCSLPYMCPTVADAAETHRCGPRLPSAVRIRSNRATAEKQGAVTQSHRIKLVTSAQNAHSRHRFMLGGYHYIDFFEFYSLVPFQSLAPSQPGHGAGGDEGTGDTGLAPAGRGTR